MADVLESTYSKIFGSRLSKGQLYTGFFLLLVGVGLAVAGIVVYQVGVGKGDSPNSYEWREAGLVMASLSAPSIFLGIFWALPSKIAMRTMAGIGTILCVLGAILFSAYYPLNFNVAGSGQNDHTFLVVSVFTVGLILLLGGTFTSLIGYYVSRVTGGAAGPARGARGSTEFEAEASRYQYDIPDSVIERDIELAMKRYKYSWGGEGTSEQSTTGIQINVPDEFEKGVRVGGKGIARTVQMEAPQVDDATKKLRGMRSTGGERQLPGQWAEDSTKALMEFRKKKEALTQAKAAGGSVPVGAAGRRPGFWARLWARLTGRKIDARPVAVKAK